MRVEVSALSVRFGPRKVFTDLTLIAPKGEITAITGHNGSGKSTLLLTILGEHFPKKGKVSFFENSNEIEPTVARRKSTLVAPYLNLYEGLTAEENLMFFAQIAGRQVTGRDINDIFVRIGLEGRGGDLVSAYSSGMKQRLRYAVAMLLQPNYLFVDEPTTNLDRRGKDLVYELLDEFKSTSAVLMATNEQEDLAHAGTVHRLD